MDSVALERSRAAEEREARPHARSMPGLATLARWRGFLAVVVAPTLLAAVYLFAIAARQYQSEADFTVETIAQTSQNAGSSLAQMFGLTSSMIPSVSNSYIVGDYLNSHDAVAALQKDIGLSAMFQRPEADLINRLRPEHPTAEQLLKYYQRQVKVSYVSDTGITTLRARAFRAADARAIAEHLLQLGEERVNLLNQRLIENALSVAGAQLRQAEAGVSASEGGLTRFRQGRANIDPDRSSVAEITLLASLRQQLAQSRAQVEALGRAVQHDSPQYVAAERQMAALAAQVDAQGERLAGSSQALAPDLGAFESLKLRQDFAQKRYESAATALEAAREQALKQQLYVVRVVEPDLPQSALYPRRWTLLLTVFFSALLVYGIGWLILAGVKEHA